jgi:hypothetical protein
MYMNILYNNNYKCMQVVFCVLQFTVDAIEVLIKYCIISFPQVDQFIAPSGVAQGSFKMLFFCLQGPVV